MLSQTTESRRHDNTDTCPLTKVQIDGKDYFSLEGALLIPAADMPCLEEMQAFCSFTDGQKPMLMSIAQMVFSMGLRDCKQRHNRLQRRRHCTHQTHTTRGNSER